MTHPVLVLPLARRTAEEKARELQRLDCAENRIAARRVEMVAGLARDRSDADDRPPGSVGAASPDWGRPNCLRRWSWSPGSRQTLKTSSYMSMVPARREDATKFGDATV